MGPFQVQVRSAATLSAGVPGPVGEPRLTHAFPLSFRGAARPAAARLACLAACALAPVLSAHAATLKENFNAAFPAWESRWFGKNSNAVNWCGVNWCPVDNILVPPDDTVRGIAGSGMVLTSAGGIPSFPITISFTPEFGATIRAMTIGAAVYVDSVFSAWDADGNLVYSKVVKVDDYRDVPTSRYQTLRFKAPAGIARFSFSGPADGNTVIDDIAVDVLKP